MTGASGPDWKSQGVVGSILIEKPFAPAQLATAVSQLLDTGGCGLNRGHGEAPILRSSLRHCATDRRKPRM
jgi:hypothetical protein